MLTSSDAESSMLILDGQYFKQMFDLYKYPNSDTALHDSLEDRAARDDKQPTLEESLSGRVTRPVIIDDIELVRLLDYGTREEIYHFVLHRRLNQFIGNRKRTAKSLGISARTVRDILRRERIKHR